jgi:hypothetical protein
MNFQQEQRSTMMAEIIRPMFISLPLPRGVDADELLRGYLVALEGLLPGALRSVVLHLVRGTWHDEVKFCPRPPELANMVRFEQRRVEAMNRQRLPAPAAVQHQFRDLRIIHHRRADELSKQGYRLIAESITSDAFISLGKSRAIPAGSIHLWAIDEVWAPADVAHLVDIHRVETKKRAGESSLDPMTPEKAEYWSKIGDLKDAPSVTAEQMGFRRKIEADLKGIKPDDAGRAAA